VKITNPPETGEPQGFSLSRSRMTEVACENVIQLLLLGGQVKMFYDYALCYEPWD